MTHHNKIMRNRPVHYMRRYTKVCKETEETGVEMVIDEEMVSGL